MDLHTLYSGCKLWKVERKRYDAPRPGAGMYVQKPYLIEAIGLAVKNELDKREKPGMGNYSDNKEDQERVKVQNS